MKVMPFADGCLVKLLDSDPRLPTVTKLILPNSAKDDINSVRWGTLQVIGPGRMCGEQRIPNLEALNWAPGDTVLCLDRYRQWAGSSQHGPEYADTVLINDFDILARVIVVDGKRRLEPAWGRAVVRPERAYERQALRSKIIVLTPRGDAGQTVPCGEVVALAPYLRETTGSTNRAGWSARSTVEYAGVDYDQGFKVGDRIMHSRAACHMVYLDNEQLLIINTRAVLAVVSPDAYVE